MDVNLSTVGGILGLISLVVTIIFNAVHHKKLVSKCCGKTYDMSVDIVESSPVIPKLVVKDEASVVIHTKPKTDGINNL